jgi:hypothetical protein
MRKIEKPAKMATILKLSELNCRRQKTTRFFFKEITNN